MEDIYFNTLIWKEGGIYVSYCSQLDVSSCGDTVEEARRMLKEAVSLFVEGPGSLEHSERYWRRQDFSNNLRSFGISREKYFRFLPELWSLLVKRGNTLRILEESEIRSRVGTHEQLFQCSCIPSAVEMVLKLLDKVDENYYEHQIEWANLRYRSFEFFSGQEYEGIVFCRHWLPAKELFRVIDNELEEGRYVIISLKNPGENPFHMWIIYGKTDEDYLNFSKAPCSSQMITFQCRSQCNLRDYVRNVMRETDILTYTEVT